MDVTRTKKAASASTTGGDASRLIIQSRPIMEDGSAATNSGQSEPATAPTLPPSKKVIVPISADGSDKSESPESSRQAVAKEEPKEAPEPSRSAITDPSPAKPVEEAEEIPKEVAKSEPEKAEKQEGASRASMPDTGTESESDDEKPSPETQKAVEEAAKAEARERELEEYIDKREFFVPIDAVARKRSVKVSAGLTVLVLLLAVVLIDLMLDTGVILLVQKIPHTHFFTTNNGN